MADVIVVDDSQFMRVQIAEILKDGGHTVLAKAPNGHAGVQAVKAHEPDVVTMDVKMPGMDGIEAVREIMATQPTPVVMLSRYTDDGAETTLEAIDAGAVEFMMKPKGEVSTELVAYADELVDLVEAVAGAEVESQTQPDLAQKTQSTRLVTPKTDISPSTWETPPTIVIAASTGGPRELHSILGSFPGTIGARVLIVQHMPAEFTGRFADRLDNASALAVREARAGDRVGQNEALLAPGGKHLEIDRETGRELVVGLTEDPPVHNVRPAADVTLQSVADRVTGPIIASVLTGMGRDGAAGVKSVADVGGSVIVQSPDSASISSMPERAIETNVVDRVVPSEQIPDALIECIESFA